MKRHVIMIVPLSSAEDGDLVNAMTAAAANAANGGQRGSNPLPRVRLYRSASLASWNSPKQ